MKQRQAGEHDVVVRQHQQASHDDVPVAPQASVGQLGALGRAGRSRRVQHDGGVGRIAQDRLAVLRQTTRQPRQLGVVDEPQLRAGALRAVGRRAGKSRASDQRLGAGVRKVELHLAALHQRVHRHHDGAQPPDAVVGDRCCGDVRQHHPDPIPGTDPLALEQRGQPRRRGVQFRVGHRVLIGDCRRPLRDTRGAGNKIESEIRHCGSIRPAWVIVQSSRLRPALSLLRRTPRPRRCCIQKQSRGFRAAQQ